MGNKKINILRVISTLNPKFGGPSKTSIDSSIAMTKKGINIDIVTHDHKDEIFFRSKKWVIAAPNLKSIQNHKQVNHQEA